ncbi:MAG: chromate efflux transporter [Streptosporangiaceae bacterium]
MTAPTGPESAGTGYQASLGTVLREWGRIGCIGFGGPPAHIALLRRLCVDDRGWLDPREFEDAISACNLLPGPASTELAIYCAWRVRGRPGALAGGAAFIVPGLICILALSVLFLAGSPPLWVRGLGAGAGAAVAAVAIQAGWSLLMASWTRAAARRARWVVYLLAGGTAAATIGPWLVLVLLGCGVAELAIRHAAREKGEGTGKPGPVTHGVVAVPVAAGLALAREHAGGLARAMWAKAHAGGLVRAAAHAGGLARVGVAAAGGGVLASVAWVAFKVGALSFGGGFVIIPLMRADAVGRGWMTSGQFLNAVALGQITPGPVVQTVAAVGYAAAGVGGGLLAALVAFSPSFAFVLGGARYFGSLRGSKRAQAFLEGSGPAAIGAILGSAIPLTAALGEAWQYAVLAGAVVLLLGLRRGVVFTLVAAAAVGLAVALAGGPLPH